MTMLVSGLNAYGYLKAERSAPPGAHFSLRFLREAAYVLHFCGCDPEISEDVDLRSRAKICASIPTGPAVRGAST